MTDANANTTDNLVVQCMLRHADDRLVLGHRLSEWCGHGPILEEDIALSNIALDLVGQAQFMLELAGKLEGKGRTADDLAFLRDVIAYRNLLLCEQPNGDFAVTIARQFMFDAWSVPMLQGMAGSRHEGVAAIAAKALKEDQYHLRHSRQWVLRLGDGTDESHRRMQAAFDDLWMFSGELFMADDVDDAIAAQGIAPGVATVRDAWTATVESTLKEATLTLPDSLQYMIDGGRRGRHTEHLGHMLDVMQILPRSHPGASW
ncbi:MAG: 1,2-phenylacetyl-CoA epoxidase subunit PaaC [Planctomycetota bacterium]